MTTRLYIQIQNFYILCSANLVPSVITELISLADTVLVGLLSTHAGTIFTEPSPV